MQRETLCRAGQRILLEPRPFKLLVYLLRHRARVVSRQELLAHLWPNLVPVPDHALHQCLGAVRAALGDGKQTPRYIQTRHNRGYRFVRVVQEDAFDPASHPTIEPRPLSTDHRMLVLLARMMALSRRTVRQALAGIRGRV